ncbi:hypothetical protein [Aliiglaciecola litoralis]|uniref:Class IIb bacteriocin, lactobin A/cerein 7B family n=1 Tax=Aliiglaciecola litoralis TaxID=582857 RepID=A0ABP3WND1_9ALTE
MYELTNKDVHAISGCGATEEQQTGYVIGYAVGFLVRAAAYTFGGRGGYKLGLAAYDAIHKSN